MSQPDSPSPASVARLELEDDLAATFAVDDVRRRDTRRQLVTEELSRSGVRER